MGEPDEEVKLVINTATAIEGNYTVKFVVNETRGDGEYNIDFKKFELIIPQNFDQLDQPLQTASGSGYEVKSL